MCTWQMFCLDFSNLQERGNISKFYINARGYWFSVYAPGNEFAWVFPTREMFQPKHCVDETKYLGAIQNQISNFLAEVMFFFQYALAIAMCQGELERLIFDHFLDQCLTLKERGEDGNLNILRTRKAF